MTESWVNTKSGKYWKPGSRYYGKTKQGEYIPEEEAVQKGYRPANGIAKDYEQVGKLFYNVAARETDQTQWKPVLGT
jgi:hypothetical protein